MAEEYMASSTSRPPPSSFSTKRQKTTGAAYQSDVTDEEIFERRHFTQKQPDFTYKQFNLIECGEQLQGTRWSANTHEVLSEENQLKHPKEYFLQRGICAERDVSRREPTLKKWDGKYQEYDMDYKLIGRDDNPQSVWFTAAQSDSIERGGAKYCTIIKQIRGKWMHKLYRIQK